MHQWLERLREWATRDKVTHYHDPCLGELLINETCWECTVASKSGPIILRVGGRYEPEPVVLTNAGATFERIDEFVGEVEAYLAIEAQNSLWRQFCDEIRSLRIHDVSFWWPRNPDSGMIFFDGPDECRLWH